MSRRFTAMVCIIALCFTIAACSGNNNNDQGQQGQHEQGFRIAVIPVQTEGQLAEAIDELQVLLQDALDRPVTINDYPDYNAVVEAMNFGQVDMAFYGPLTYVIAHHQSGAEAIIVQLVKDKPTYYSYIITHKENPWNSLDELLAAPEEIKFAYGDPNSTSGSLVPGMELKSRGVFTSQDEYEFESVQYTGSHDVTALAVQNKEVDAGAIDSAIYDNLVEQGVIDNEQFKIIWQSDELFQYPWAVSKDTDADTIAKLQEAFLSITDETILNGFGISGFAKTSNEDYESIRAAAEADGRLP